MSDEIQKDGANALSEHFQPATVEPVEQEAVEQEAVADLEHVATEVAADVSTVESDAEQGHEVEAAETAASDAAEVVGEVKSDVEQIEHPAPAPEPPAPTPPVVDPPAVAPLVPPEGNPPHLEAPKTDKELAVEHGVEMCPICGWQFLESEARPIVSLTRRVKALLGL